MKPKRLEFCGINSFSEKAVIDFDSLLAGGIFGIFGDTGSGKTTILDSMIFALYGRIDRTRGGNASEIINFNCEKAYVQFDFECEWDGKRRLFRVERTIKRKNSQQELALDEIENGAVRCVSDGVKKTNEKILDIIGLSFEDFKKCIALPQGEFAQFVKADRSERLRLISRLFDLELYGDRLNAVLKTRYDAAGLALAEKEGRLGEYAEYTEQALQKLEEELLELSAKKDFLDKEYEEQSAAFEKVKSGYERAKKLSAVRAALKKAGERREEFVQKKKDAQRLSAAANIAAVYERAEKAKKESAACLANAEKAAAERDSFAKQLSEKAAAYDAAGYDNALADIMAKRAVLKAAGADIGELAEAKKERETLASEYKAAVADKSAAEKELAAAEKKMAELQEKLESFGEQSPEEYFRNHFESALLQSEYAAERAYFEEKLSLLREKYPHEGELYFAAEKELTERGVYFKRLAESDKFSDAALLMDNFKKAQSEQDNCKNELHRQELLRTRTSAKLADAEGRLARAADAGAKAKQKIEALSEKLEKVLGGVSIDAAAYEKELSRREAKLCAEREDSRKVQELFRKKIGEAEVSAARSAERGEALCKEYESAQAELFAKLQEGNFTSIEESTALLAKYPDAEALADEIEEYEKELRDLEASERALMEGGEPEALSDDAFAARAEQFAALGDQRERTGKEAAVFKNEIDRFSAKLKAKKALEKERDEIRKHYELIEKLRNLFRGNAFMEFVAGEYLSDISASATETLLHLTNGRYFIRYEQGFYVGDNFNGGELRSVNTLSGGETFLVSLSLALALSAAIYAKSLRPIEFFFLDEGFGTLDEKLIDTVMDSLEKLKNTHFSIGLISHVEELKHRIGNKITVISAEEGGGSSKIKISC